MTRPSTPVRRCLRCGRRPRAPRDWQCDRCREDFADWDDRDWGAILDLLGTSETSLVRIADRLDGAGLWSGARSIMQSAERVQELRAEIERQRRG